MINPFILANKLGIPRLESTGVTISDSAATFTFNPHLFLNYPFLGLILVKLPALPSGTATTLPIYFNSGSTSTTVALTTYGGSAVTTANISNSGVYLTFYDSSTKTLQLIG